MTRSTAWDTIRGRRHARTSKGSIYRGPRVAAIIATEWARPIRLGDPTFEEWASLEFRHPTPPSDEDWYR